MRVIEAERGKKIDVLIIDLLIAAQGEQRAVAFELGISPGSLSAWIGSLQLTESVNRVRQGFDLPETMGHLGLETRDDQSDDLSGNVNLSARLAGPCSSCSKALGSLPYPREFKRVSHNESESVYYVEIRDGEGDRHWFPLMDSNPPPGAVSK
tara:strand:+ start:4327 stop:4785 length:459 start_codon:yes stop_codon:yes gene_type:complete